MSSKLTRCLGVLLIFLSLSSLSKGALEVPMKKGYYTFVAPSTIKPDSTFHVSFTLNDFHKPCWFNISINSYEKTDNPFEFKSIEVKPGTTKLVELHAPHFNSTLGDIFLYGYRGIISVDNDLIHFESERSWVFIQTNKAKYRPGDLVKFRVICIDQLKRPAKLKQGTYLQIYDNQYNILRSIFNIELVKGVFRSEFQLSDVPNLGEWGIRVLFDYSILADKIFEVDRYELQKFFVKINTRNVVIDEEEISFDVSASYFYDEPVKGNLSIIVTHNYAPYPQQIATFSRETQIDGSTKIVFNLEKDLEVKSQSEDPSSYPFSADSTSTTSIYEFQIEAHVIDGLSEERSWSATVFQVFSQPYNIDLQAPSVFGSDPILNIKVQVTIKDLHDNSIENPTTAIEIVVGCNIDQYEYDYKTFDIVRHEYKTGAGRDFAMINVTNKNYSTCFLYAEHQRSKSDTKFMQKGPLNIDILTLSPQEGKEIEIKITSVDPIEDFSYEIISRGDIILSGSAGNEPGNNETTYILRLLATFEMVPKITIYVHQIKNKRFRGQMKDVIIQRAFSNWIAIETVNEATPGESVYVNVTTDEGSYIGLMGLDRSALQSIQKKDILDTDNVNNRLAELNSLKWYDPVLEYGGRYGDIITFSNAFLGNAGFSEGGLGGLEPSVRRRFPESWLYVDFETTPEGGIHFVDTAPDTITTWAITGFSINPDTGLTFTKNTTNLRVFQEFFIEMDLPSSVKEGETIEIPIYLSNYMNEDALANVTIKSESEDLEIMDDPETFSESKQNISKQIAVKKREKILFYIKPLKHGVYNVTVNAISSAASDAIQKTLNVQPDGISYAMSKNYLVHLGEEESSQENEITIDIPDKAVPGSERVEVSVVGDIFRPLVKDLEKLARVPYGNGEDNMRLIISNTIALKYLKALNYSNPTLETKLKLNLDLGYQNQLSYKYLDGSFGLFERKTERTGDIWQTVFALWGLTQANDFAQVDSKVISRGLEYLQSKQQKNGCIKSDSGLEEDVKLTAFGLMVFLMDEFEFNLSKLQDNSTRIFTTDGNKLQVDPSSIIQISNFSKKREIPVENLTFTTTHNEVIKRGLKFLYETTDDLEDSPISLMSAYTLILGDHEKAQDLLKKLTSNSHLTSKQMQWTKSDTLQSHLETIADSLINLFDSQEIPEQGLLHIVRGLISSNTEKPSITHLIALQAMIDFVENLSLSRQNLNIIIRDEREDKTGDFRVNPENSQDLQSFEIPQSCRKLNLQSKGHGFAVIDVRYNYKLLPENQSSPFFTINISSKKISKYLGVLKICSNVSEKNNNKNNLTIMEVNLQSGFIFAVKDSQEDETLSEDIKSIQHNDSREKVVVYIEPKANATCVELNVRKAYKVFNSKPGSVVVYGAYDKDEKASKSFTITDL